MATNPSVLQGAPFFVTEAYAAGLSWDELQSAYWRRLSRGQYVSSRVRHDAELELRAAQRRLPAEAAFSGRTAAWLFGVDSSRPDRIEATVARDVPVRARAGFVLRRAALSDRDVIVWRGFRTTSPMRTAWDLGSRVNLVESVVALDQLLNAGLIELDDLLCRVANNAGAKGVKRLRRAVRLADGGAESPMETRLRLALVLNRLPSPLVQVNLHDAGGRFIARVDLYYPDRRLAIEYDGAHHKDQLPADVRRQNAIVNAGHHILRFTARDLDDPRLLAAEVRRARSRLTPAR